MTVWCCHTHKHLLSLTFFLTIIVNSFLISLMINVGPNTSPLTPPKDKSVGVLAVEANIAIASYLKTKMKNSYPGQFFVVNSALSSAPIAGSFANFHFYNRNGLSSSLSQAIRPTWNSKKIYDSSFGSAGIDIVPVLSLGTLLNAIPNNITISLLKTDTQGHDFSVVQSATTQQLQMIEKIISETYLADHRHTYQGVQNDLEKDWIPFMSSIGFRLSNPPDSLNRKRFEGSKGEYDAVWIK